MIIPPHCLRVLGDLKPNSKILELGNKKNTNGLFREWYVSKDLLYWCTDINGRDGAIIWDIRLEPPKEILKNAPYDVITNFGFTEHVQTDEGQEACWRNIHNLLNVGGQLSCTLPQPGYWKNHGKPSGYPGIYYPYPEFFENFAELNGYIVDDLWVDEQRHTVCCRLYKTKDDDFIMPSGMFKNA